MARTCSRRAALDFDFYGRKAGCRAAARIVSSVRLPYFTEATVSVSPFSFPITVTFWPALGRILS